MIGHCSEAFVHWYALAALVLAPLGAAVSIAIDRWQARRRRK